MSIIKTKELTKYFGKHLVLEGINLIVEEGDFYGLLGRNGAGKSTLINVLTGVSYKTSGKFQIINVEDAKIESVKKEIGVMPDVSNLYGEMNGFEFLKYMGDLKKIHLTKKEIKNVMNSVCLNVPLQMKIKNYSFGMKKKICIAQAILGTPKLIYLDEPTSGIDPESIIHLHELFRKLNQSGSTIFLTSHNLNEIEKLCNKIGILKEGKLKETGSIKELKEKYSSNFQVEITYKEQREGILESLLKDYSFSYIQQNAILVEIESDTRCSEMIEFLINNQVSVYSVVPKKVSLEEIFLN